MIQITKEEQHSKLLNKYIHDPPEGKTKERQKFLVIPQATILSLRTFLSRRSRPLIVSDYDFLTGISSLHALSTSSSRFLCPSGCSCRHWRPLSNVSAVVTGFPPSPNAIVFFNPFGVPRRTELLRHSPFSFNFQFDLHVKECHSALGSSFGQSSS